jgi:hypothetical protein
VDLAGRSVSVRGEIRWPSAGTIGVRPRGDSVAVYGELCVSAVRAPLEILTDRFGHVLVPPRRDPGEHPLDDERVEQVGGAEHLPGGGLDFGVLDSAAPGTRRLDLAAAQDDRALRRAVPVADPRRGRDLGVLLADPLGELGLHHLVHHDEPGRRREREQPVFDRAGDLAQRNGRLEREFGQLGRLLRLVDTDKATFFFTVVVPFLVGLSCSDARSLPAGRSQAGDHRLTSTTWGTTSERVRVALIEGGEPLVGRH